MEPTTWILIIGGALVMVLLIVGIVMSSNSERTLVEDRLGRYLEDDEKDLGEGEDSSFLTEWVNRRVEKSSG